MGKKEQFKFRTSRKTYIPFYLMVVFLAVLLFFLSRDGFKVEPVIIGAGVIFLIVVLNLTETHRISSSYEVASDSLTCTYGILNKKVKKVDYFAISDMFVNQTFWQWLFGYGDIDIQLFSRENKSSIKNINKPLKFISVIEKMMAEKREK